MAKQVKEMGFDMLSNDQFLQSLPGEEAPSNGTTDTIVVEEEKADTLDGAAKEENKADASDAKEQLTADEIKIALEKRQKEAGKTEDKKDDVTKDTKKDKDAPASEKKEDKKDDKTAGDGKDAAGTDDDKSLVFDNPDDIKAPENSDGETYTWKELAKEGFGIEIPEDTQEALIEAVNKKAEINIGKYAPETQRVIKFTEAGGTADDFIEPFKKVDSLLALEPADLVRKDYEARKWAADKIEARIQFLTENEGLDGEYEILKEKLTAHRESVKENIITERIKAKEIADQKAATAFKDEAKHIKTQLESRKDFMDTPLNEKNREYIIKKYENGDYDKDFKNPEVIADYLLYKEFGKKGLANYRQKIEKEVKKSYQAERHNVPPTNGAAAGSIRSTPSGHDPMGNFDMLEKEKV